MARTRGENRFYVSPGMRKYQQQKQQQEQKPSSISKNCTAETEKRLESDHFGSSATSTCSVSGRVGSEGDSTNFDRFLEYTTPMVPAQFLPKVNPKSLLFVNFHFCLGIFLGGHLGII